MGSTPLWFQPNSGYVEHVWPLFLSPPLRRRPGQSLLSDSKVLESAQSLESRASPGTVEQQHRHTFENDKQKSAITFRDYH